MLTLDYDDVMLDWVHYSSKAIRGFPMHDPHERKFPIYLPPNYNPKRKEPYPVVFILAGWAGRSSKYVSDGSVFDIPMDQRLDQAIERKELNELIAVFPDGTSKWGHSQYINSPSFGNYSDYICDELVDFVDSKYHTHKSANFRGIMGHSSGGFGALVNGFLRSDRFQYVCSSAGDTFFELSLLPGAIDALNEVEKSGSISKFFEEFFLNPNPSNWGGKKMHAMMTLSLAPCYAPNPTKGPLFGDVFFDLRDGQIIPEIWQKYLQWDPIHLVHRHKTTAQKLKFIHLECGLQDEYGMLWGHRRLAKELGSLGISYQIDEYPGTHSGHNHRYTSRIKLMLQKMK